MSRRRNILAVTHRLPRPDWHAGCQRFVAILTHLARVHRVDLWPLGSDVPPDVERGYRAAVEAVGVRVLSADGPGGLPAAVYRRRYDLCWFEFWRQAAAQAGRLRAAQPWAPHVVDTVDVHFVRHQAAADLGLMDPAEVADQRDRELAAYRAADAVVAVTADDHRALAAAGGMPRLAVVPLVVPPRPRSPGRRPPAALFVGGFRHPPNVDGVLWFAREVWPRVRAAAPAATLTVVGPDPPAEVRELSDRDGVTVAGWVPDVGPLLDRAAVSVAPLRFGAGMKGKVTEAMAAGLPVVTTAAGVQGLGLTAGEHAVVADDPAEFAAAVVGLFADPDRADRLGAAGQRLVAELCSPAAVGRQLDELVAAVAPHPARPPRRWWLAAALWTAGNPARKLILRARRAVRAVARRARPRRLRGGAEAT